MGPHFQPFFEKKAIRDIPKTFPYRFKIEVQS